MDAQALAGALIALDDSTLIRVINQSLQRRPELAPSIASQAIPDLTFAPADALSKRRSQGWIKPFGQQGQAGFGFIACPELKAVFGNDVYCHRNQLGSFQAGQEVSFAVLLSKDMKPQAFDLQPLAPGSLGPKGGGWSKGGDDWGKGKGDEWGLSGWSKGGDEWGKGKGDEWGKGGGSGWSGWGGGYDEWSGGKGPYGKGDISQDDGKGCGKDKKGAALLSEHARPDVQSIIGIFAGLVKSFNAKNGFGFIECEALRNQGIDRDVYVHHHQIGTFQVGSLVMFTAYYNKKNQPQAMDLQPLPGS